MERFLQFLLSDHTCSKIGAGIGLAVGLCFVLFGFLKTLLILGCIAAGYIIGRIMDDNYSDFDDFTQMFHKK